MTQEVKTKQEEIREGIATVIRVNKDKFAKCLESEMAEELTEKLIDWMTDAIRYNLHSQDVAIKVRSVSAGHRMKDVYKVEPLVEEG